MNGLTAFILSKNYTNKVGSTINGTNYNYNTGELTFNTADGDWVVPVNNGMTQDYKNTLDNVIYDSATNTLLVDGKDVLTAENTESEDIDFSGMF